MNRELDLAAKADASPGERRPGPSRTVVNSMLWATLPILLIVQLLTFAALEFSNLWSAKEKFDARMVEVAESRAPLIAEPLWKMRYEQIANIQHEILGDRAITSVTIYDDTDTAVASARERPANMVGGSVRRPINYRNGNIAVEAGSIQIAYSYDTLYAGAGTAFLRLLVVGVIATLAMLVALRISANIFVGNPLSAMIATIRRSERDGRAYSAEINANNEFGQLADAFNGMQRATTDAIDRLGYLARHDPLTGLPNRRALSERLASICNEVRCPELLVALHFLDLDDFKAVNDTFGHEAGDRLLVNVAERLRGAIAPEDWVARLGGDEFVVIQFDVEGEEHALALAERLLAAISLPIEIHDKKIAPRGSIGVAVRKASDPEVVRLPTLADIALYQAKSRSQGTVAILNEALQKAHDRRRELELAIPAAFAERQFEVWYQSQIELRNNRVVGLEALIRWRHPEHGLIGPDEFLPLIERGGNGARLTLFVLEDACMALATLAASGRSDIRVAINLPPSELTDHSFADQLQAVCARLDVPTTRLELEITEGSLINNIAGTFQVLERLRSLGVTIALDDFGTGYSSLAHMRRFPLDKIKIDKAFIRDIPGNAEDKAIVGIIASLAKTLNLTVVAEGIERIEQARAMADIGVAQGQGYFYQRPQPLLQVLAFLGEPRNQTAGMRVITG
ncbi:MAG: EAL domain-containing protein [bacterium]|nr:EAL domain-containing protein [bacterium]